MHFLNLFFSFSSVDHLPLATFGKELYLDQLGIPPGLVFKTHMNLDHSAKYTITFAILLDHLDYGYLDLNTSL